MIPVWDVYGNLWANIGNKCLSLQAIRPVWSHSPSAFLLSTYYVSDNRQRAKVLQRISISVLKEIIVQWDLEQVLKKLWDSAENLSNYSFCTFPGKLRQRKFTVSSLCPFLQPLSSVWTLVSDAIVWRQHFWPSQTCLLWRATVHLPELG